MARNEGDGSSRSLAISSLTVVCFLCVGLCCQAASAHDCAVNNVNVTKCIANVSDLQQHHDLANYIEEAKLDGVCHKVEEAEKCLIRHNCEEDKSETLVTKWKGVKDSFNYLCKTGREEFLEQSNCWGSTEAGINIAACGTNLNSGFDTASHEEKCSKIDAYITCLKTSVARDCNEKASVVKTRFAIKFLKPVAQQGNCKIGEDDGDLDDDGIQDSEQISSAFSNIFMPRLSFIVIFNTMLLPLLSAVLLNTC